MTRFFIEEPNLDKQAEDYLKSLRSELSPQRRIRLNQFFEEYKNMDRKTAMNLLAGYVTTCGNLE